MIRTTTAGGVTTITLDRPEKLNAFSGTMREDLLAALRDAAGDGVGVTRAGRALGDRGGGACNLALACDYRIASEQAKFSESFVRIGLHPDWGGTWLLPRLIGTSRAFEMMATGRMVEP